ncbi:HAD family phosphatase [Candidatus Berkelbacteria bacterium]|nr:HAD family phosphatase [Candidatus Berkelbacteria bacterium]
MTKIKAIVFDFAGVVTTHGIENAIKHFWKIVPLWKLPVLLIFALFYLPKIEKGEITEVVAWRKSHWFLGKKTNIFELRDKILEHFILNQELIKEIKKLKPRYKIAMLTNNIEEWMDHFENEFHLSKIFDPMLNSAEVGLRKPNPKIFKLLLGQLNLKPAECLFVDDHRRNLWSAQSLGFKTLLFRNNRQFLNNLKKMLDNNKVSS